MLLVRLTITDCWISTADLHGNKSFRTIGIYRTVSRRLRIIAVEQVEHRNTNIRYREKNFNFVSAFYWSVRASPAIGVSLSIITVTSTLKVDLEDWTVEPLIISNHSLWSLLSTTCFVVEEQKKQERCSHSEDKHFRVWRQICLSKKGESFLWHIREERSASIFLCS